MVTNTNSKQLYSEIISLAQFTFYKVGIHHFIYDFINVSFDFVFHFKDLTRSD